MNSLFYLTMEHLMIVSIATVISVIIGISLGIVAYWFKYFDTAILWISEAIQTIPSLALLCILMIVFGLGNITIIAGLVLYALLPIIRNTHTGLTSLSPHIKDAAKGMGMSKIQRLVKIELPLAFPHVFSGIKIAVVNSLSIAVMGVLIGAGGLGFPILRGIQTQNFQAIITGAIPVMVMAILFEFGMSKIEKRLIKKAN